MAITKTVEDQGLTVDVETGASLSGYTGLTVWYTNPSGVEDSVSGAVQSSTRIRGLIPRADLIPGDWFFWAEADEPGGEHRVTFAEKVRVIQRGAVS